MGVLSIGALSGVIKATTGTLAAATDGTDYLSPTTSIKLKWNIVASAGAPHGTTLVVGNAYVPLNTGLETFTLPATATAGDCMGVGGHGSGLWTIAQNASQQIFIGNTNTTAGVGGSITATNAGDAIELLLCVVGGANTVWRAYGITGTLTVV